MLSLTFPEKLALDLTGNDLTGDLPIEYSDLEFLEKLRLANTNITGQFFSRLPASLKELQLDYMDFGRPLPDNIGRLTNLEALMASFAGLHGLIPTAIGQLTSLQFVSFWGNELSGSIPTEIGLLRELQFVDLESNAIHGRIPDEFFQLTDLSSIYLAYNNLSGTVPEPFCGLSFFNFQVGCVNITCSCCDCV